MGGKCLLQLCIAFILFSSSCDAFLPSKESKSDWFCHKNAGPVISWKKVKTSRILPNPGFQFNEFAR